MSANGISTLPSKELKQRAKLDLAATNRAANLVIQDVINYIENNFSIDLIEYPELRATYDITLLPTQYSGNVVVDNPNPDGLVLGRPWIE